MLNYKMAQDATTTSINSFNSAMREQEKYNQSLEARLNRLDTAWTSFSSTVGDKVLYDSIVVITEGLNDLADDGESAVSGIGALAPAFGLVGVASYALSGSLRTLISSTYATSVANVAATGSTGLYAKSLAGLATMANVAKIALRGLLIASGVGVAFAVVGFAIEKVVNVMSDMIQKQEELDEYNQKSITALTENKEKTEELLASYKRLSDEKENGKAWNTEKEKEYLNVQQTLAEIYPALIGRIDSTGKAHLKNNEAIEKELETTRKLIDAQNRVTVSGAIEEFDKLKTAMDGSWYESFGNYFMGSLEEQMKNIRQVLEDNSGTTVDTSKLEVELLNLEQQYQLASDEIKSHIYEIIAASASLNNISIDDEITTVIQDFVQGLDVSNLDASELTLFTNTLGSLQEQIQKAVNTNDENLFGSAINGLNNLASGTKNFEVDVNGLKVSYTDLMNAIKNNGNTIAYVDGEFTEFENTTEGSGEKVKSLAETMYEFNDAIEQTVGASQKGVDALGDLIWQYDMLSRQLVNYTQQELEAIYNADTLSSEQQQIKDVLAQRIGVMQQMSSIYPDLLGKDGKAITLSEEKRDAIEKENKANQVLLDAYKLSRDGKLTAEQNMTLASAQGTKARIDNIRTEIDALNVLNKALQEYANNAAMATDENAGRGAMRASMVMANNVADISAYEDELKSLQDSLSTTTDKIGSFTSEINDSSKKSSDSNKKSSESLKESTYIVDEYKNTLAKLNLEQEKYQKILKDYPTHTNQYRKAMEAQIKLKKEELALNEKQAKTLDKQIKSGRIAQTGLITTSESKATTTTSTQKIHGADGKVTSGYGAKESFRTSPHKGIDIANKKGTRLDSFTSGKVISQGYNDISGNYVKIEDSNGFKHFYAHLEKAFAKVGDLVEAGTQIGTVGNTGRVVSGSGDGSHLHYEVKNAKGNYINPSDFVASAKNNKVTTTTSSSEKKSASTIAAEKAQVIDQAQAELNSVKSSILKSTEELDELYSQLRQSWLDGFENRRSIIDSEASHEEAKIKNVDKSSTQYTKTLDKQTELLKRKQSVNKEEIAYLEKLIAKGGIPATEVEQYQSRIIELKTDIQSLDSSIQAMTDSYLEMFDSDRSFSDTEIDAYNTKLKELDTNSTDYIRTLQNISSEMNNKQQVNNKELKYLDQQIKSGKHSGEMLEKLKLRYEQLTTSITDLSVELKKMNYEVVINIKTRYDEKIDDKDFQLQRSKLIQGMYEEGSTDYLREYDYQITKLKELSNLQEKFISETQDSMKNTTLLPEDIKQLNEELEAATLALLGYQSEIVSTQKAMSDAVKKQQEDVANKIVDAYKDYLQERKDAVVKSYDKEIEAENKRHENVTKNRKQEQDKFKEAINERLQLIERTEAERSYDMEIDELEKDRNKIQDNLNKLEIDESKEAKSKRKALQEQLDEIDKNIEDRRHDRQIELQKQSLNDLVDLKDKEVEEKEELEDKQHERAIDRIEDLKEYWDQHYTDLLNDERKFAEIKKQIVAGNYDSIRGEFSDYLSWLKGNMPDLENSLNGTMKSVGITIRQNVIDNLNEALKLMKEVQTSSTSTNKYGSSSSYDNAGKNFTNPTTSKIDTSKSVASLTDTKDGFSGFGSGDMKVLLGKYINDVIAAGVSDKSRKANIKEKAYALAAQGRSEGSVIPSKMGVNEAIGKLSKSQLNMLASFASSNNAGLITAEYQDMIKSWASKLKSQAASLDTGGMLNFPKSGGVDGKGGRFIIGHPNEVVNSPLDTKNLIQMSSITQRAAEMFTPILKAFANPSSLLSNLTNIGGDTFNVEFNVGEMIANKQSANNFGKELWNELRTKKGMR